MRKLILTLAFAPCVVVAQSNPAMQQNMMQMMEQAQKAQACVQKIDQSQFGQLQQEGDRKKAELEALCAAGKRDQAQQEAIAYSRKMMAEPVMQEMRKCSEMLRGLVPQMPFDNFEEEFKDKHICDEL